MIVKVPGFAVVVENAVEPIFMDAKVIVVLFILVTSCLAGILGEMISVCA
jgi:hypothetical protein